MLKIRSNAYWYAKNEIEQWRKEKSALNCQRKTQETEGFQKSHSHEEVTQAQARFAEV